MDRGEIDPQGRTVKHWFVERRRAAVITLEEGRVGETVAILNIIGEESADQWADLGGGEWDHKNRDTGCISYPTRAAERALSLSGGKVQYASGGIT